MQENGVAAEWFLSRDGQQHGPVSDQELAKLVALSRLLPTDYVWRQGFADWVVASAVPGLLDRANPTGPPPPPLAAHTLSAVDQPSARLSHAQSTGSPERSLRPMQGAAAGDAAASTTTALIAYILLLIPFPIGPLIGVVVAFVNRDTEPEWLATHHRWQLRTFLIGLLYVLVGALTLFFVVGGPILLATWIWSIVRYVKGISALNRREPITNLTTWLW
jgi:uncharacterized membrane protein